MSSLYWDLDFDNTSVKNCKHIFSKFGLPSIVVEIGVYLGRTTNNLVNMIAPSTPNLKYFAIDPFEDSIDIKENLTEVKNLFLSELSKYEYKENIIFMQEKSFDGLIKLKYNNIKPQFIFIDGDHTASAVLNDLVLSFDILEKGGIILCDDSTDWKYIDEKGNTDPQMSPRMAVETFIMCNWSRIDILPLPHGHQTAFVKL